MISDDSFNAAYGKTFSGPLRFFKNELKWYKKKDIFNIEDW